jgi:hypothetical protein
MRDQVFEKAMRKSIWINQVEENHIIRLLVDPQFQVQKNIKKYLKKDQVNKN